jgi:hypothetical protein
MESNTRFDRENLSQKFWAEIKFPKIDNNLPCYDHNFLRFLPIFVLKKWRFIIHFFAKASCAKNTNIFAKFFGENIF